MPDELWQEAWHIVTEEARKDTPKVCRKRQDKWIEKTLFKKVCAEIESYNKVVVVVRGGGLELNVISKS